MIEIVMEDVRRKSDNRLRETAELRSMSSALEVP